MPLRYYRSQYRTSNPQGAVPCLTDEGVGTQSPTWPLPLVGDVEFASPAQVPINVTAGWAASPS